MEKRKRILLAMGFLCVFMGIFLAVQTVLTPDYDDSPAIRGFYHLPKDTLDAAFLGSSHMFFTVDAQLLTEEYGISSYDFGASDQQPAITLYYFEELLKTQKPQVVMMDVFKIFSPNWSFHPNAIGMNYAPMPYSLARFQSAASVFNGDWGKAATYTLLPMAAWHSRWELLGASDIRRLFEKDAVPETRGFLRKEAMVPQVHAFDGEDTNTYTVPAENQRALQQMAALADEHNIRLVFFKAPAPNWSRAQSLAAKAFMEENGYEFIEMNDHLVEIGIDLNTDFFDNGHLNIYGAEKTTRYLAQYILSLDLI